MTDLEMFQFKETVKTKILDIKLDIINLYFKLRDSGINADNLGMDYLEQINDDLDRVFRNLDFSGIVINS